MPEETNIEEITVGQITESIAGLVSQESAAGAAPAPAMFNGYPVPPYPPPEETMTPDRFEQLPPHRRGLLYQARYLEGEPNYWNANGAGYCHRDDVNALFSPQQCLDHENRRSMGSSVFELLPETGAAITPAPVATNPDKVPADRKSKRKIEEEIKTEDRLNSINPLRQVEIYSLGGQPLNSRLEDSSNGVAYVFDCGDLRRMINQLWGPRGGRRYRIFLLEPSDAATGGWEIDRMVDAGQIPSLPDEARFYVRRVTPNPAGYFYMDYAVGRVVPRGLAQRMNKPTALLYANNPNYLIELLKPGKLSSFTKLFNASAVDMIKSCPNNPMIRGFMMARLRVAVPAEITTFPDIVNWVEQNVDESVPVPPRPGREQIPINITNPRPPNRTSLSVPYVGSRKFSGRCRYTDHESCEGTIAITVDELLDAISDAEDIDDAMSFFRDWITNSDNGFDWGTDDDSREYHDHESNDDPVEDEEITFANRDRARDALINFLRAHAPERAEQLAD